MSNYAIVRKQNRFMPEIGRRVNQIIKVVGVYKKIGDAQKKVEQLTEEITDDINLYNSLIGKTSIPVMEELTEDEIAEGVEPKFLGWQELTKEEESFMERFQNQKMTEGCTYEIEKIGKW